jgi:hypothetical protein
VHSIEGNTLFGTYGFIFAQSPSNSSTTTNSLTQASMHVFSTKKLSIHSKYNEALTMYWKKTISYITALTPRQRLQHSNPHSDHGSAFITSSNILVRLPKLACKIHIKKRHAQTNCIQETLRKNYFDHISENHRQNVCKTGGKWRGKKLTFPIILVYIESTCCTVVSKCVVGSYLCRTVRKAMSIM